MKKFRKRIFAAVLAALMLTTAIPGTALYASAETGSVSENAIGQEDKGKDDTGETGPENKDDGTGETGDSDTEEPGTDDAEATGDSDTDEPAQEPPAGPLEEDSAKCICETLCTEDSINGDCPVCGAEGADLSACKGKEQGGVPETDTEDDNAETDTGICKHHQEHDADCGYIPKSEDGEGSPCTYKCRICPIEDLIAALSDKVTEDNAEEVRAQLEEILALYGELNEDEQEQIDLSRCYELQEALDNANAPMQAAGEIDISQNWNNILTADEGDCPGHTFTGTSQAVTIYVASGTHDVTFSGLNINDGANVGIAPGATMNLTIDGANTIQAGGNLAGIYVPVGATLIINGTGSLNVSGRGGGAGIGGAAYVPDENSSDGNPNCGIVEINGGTITATGGNLCAAGIGGGLDADVINPGNGGTVTINAGTVVATGGSDASGSYGGAGIGGGSGNNGLSSGNGGTLTISGGHVTLAPGAHNTQWGTAYGFGRGSGDASTGTCELTLADASYLDSSTTLDPNGKYTINGDPTADMIVVPEGLVYTGQALDVSGIKIDDTKTGTGTYFNQTFTVNASAEGWVLQDLNEVKEVGEYTATFTKGDKSISKTFTVAKSGTDLTSEGKVKTYKDGAECSDFTAGDTITVKATPTPTGEASTNSAMFAASFTEPGAGQMAVFVGDTQVSEPVGAGEDGSYTMTVSAADVLTLGGVEPNGDPITLTAKFVGNDNMADAAGTVDVRISAAAKAEKGGAVTGYYGESNLADAFADSGNADATFTLLSDVEPSTYLTIQIDCTLDLGGHTITGPMGRSQCVIVETNTAVTIRGEGEITAPYGIALAVNGSVTLEGGTYTSGGSESPSVHVVGQSAMLSVTGEKVSIRNTSGGYGLIVAQAQSVQLSAGTYSGTAGAISSTVKLSDMLAHTDNIRYAYYQGDTLVTTGLDGQALTGTVTVKVCDHTGDGVCEYTPNENDASTHIKTCLACGYAETGNCGFEKTADPTADNHTGQCPYCKRDRSDAHSFSEWSGDPVARACTVCGYEQTAVAKVEKSNGGGTEYMTAKGLNTVFASNSDYEGATVTLLDDVTITEAAGRPRINIRCTLNLNGHTIRSDAVGAPPLEVSGYGNVTITGNGKVVSNSNIALLVLGTVVLEGGTFSSGVAYSGTVEVMSGNLSVTGENVVMENTGNNGYGLSVNDNAKSVQLSAGTYSGAARAISVSGSFTLDDLLNQKGTSRVAYYKDNATLVTEGLDGQTLPSGSYTVKVCTHAYRYTHTTGATTHSQSCPACGDAKAAETCSYDAATGRCACGSTLAVTLPADLALTYDGTAKTPAVTVTVDGTPLTEGYSVAYNNNINAGNAAAVTITGTSFTGTATLTFSIGKATPTITWSSTTQELTYTGQQAVITAPTVTLENNENFSGTISYSYKKQGETAYKDGLPTDAGTYMIKAHVDAEGNYNAADSTNEPTLTIKKADTEITVGTAAYYVNYGDPAFPISGVTDTNPEAGLQYAVAKGKDVISVSNGTVTIINAGTAAITVSLPETANYNAAVNKTITVTVAKKGGYTVSEINKKHYYDRENTAEINLAALLPRDCGTVTYGEPETSGNVTFTAKAVENGMLSYALAKGNVNDAGTITVTVTTRNYEDITATVKVVLTEQIPVELKEGTEVTLADNILTYGESLSGLGFNKAVFVDGDGKTVEGILAWKDAAAKPEAGTASAVWVFTPTDKAYAPVEGTAAITVNKAVPTVSAAPAVADRIYNPSVTLKSGDLSGGTATGVDGKELEGIWGWQRADIVPVVNNSGYVAVFTPADTTNYETVTRTITVNVTKATPYIAKSPAAAGITYGDTLNASPLSGGTVQYGNGAGQAGDGAGSTAAVAGTFTWKEPSTKPVAADSNVTEYTVVFTPSDTANYNPVEAKATLTVNKVQNAPNMPGSTMDVSNSLEKVGDISLPEGWEWQDSDKETALEAGMAVRAVAVYIGADKGNYENETVEVTITRSTCEHTEGEILYTGDGESEPTCTKEGLGHTACTKCGAVVREYITVSALGHDYDAGEVTKEPTLEDEGERKYTCKRCGHTYTETIPRKKPQGLWIDHMQPSMNYTGAAIRQEQIEVYYGTTMLREKVDYTISYKNNTNAGTAQVIVTGKGNYTGKAVETFEIRPVDIGTQPGMTAIVATAVETGKTLRPAVTVTWNGKKLKEKTDYTLSYHTSIKTAGAYEVTVSGTRNYTGSMVKAFVVKPRGTKLLKSAAVSGIKKGYTYPGSGLAADLQGVVVKMGKATLIKGTDYTVRTENTDVVGTGTVIIEAAQTDAYAGEKRIAVRITGTDLKKGSIKGVEKSYPYTGMPITPQITVYSGKSGKGEVIPADKYTVSYTNNTEKGKATVTATGIPEKGYSGSVKVTYQIGGLNLAAEKAAGNLKVTMPADISHAKGGAKPQPVITYTYGGVTRTLREGADYTLKYSNHTTATGSKPPTLKITGKGNYSGSITETFVIAKQDIGRLSITVTDRAYGKTRKGSYYYSAPKVYDLDGKRLKSGRDYTVQYTYADSGNLIGKNDKIEAGTKLCAVVAAHEKSSYTGTLRATYVVREAKAVKDIGKAKNDRIENQPYTGSAITPEVRLYTQTGKIKTYLTEEDYEVIGCYNNSRRGTATILVRGKGAYSGVKRITFKIVQKKIR